MSKNKESKSAQYMGVGIAIGVALGVALDNIGLGIALGVVFGAAMSKKKQSNDEDKTLPEDKED